MEELKSNKTIQEQKQEEVIKYGINDLIKMPPFTEAVIVKIETKKAKEVFGDKATKPEQIVMVLTYESENFSIKNNETYNHYPIGKVPEQSKLGKFITKYGKLEVGMIISLIQNTTGYYTIVIE